MPTRNDDHADHTRLTIEVRERAPDGTLPIELAGELDMDATFKLEPELERRLGEAGTQRVVLDLGGVEFMDSAGLGALLSTRERAEMLGIELSVANPSEAVQRVLEMTGASRLLD